LHRLFAYLAKNPHFSGALLSTNHDSVASFYYSLPPAAQDNAGCQNGGHCEFDDQLAELIAGTLSSGGPGRLRAFVPVGSTHGFLPSRFQLGATGVPLKAFLDAQLADDPSWTDAIEPSW